MSAATGHSEPPPQAHGRMNFADRLKVALTMLVIAHHAAQPYGPTGGAWPVHNAQHSPWLEPFFAVNAAFFMGLFFLVSGFFVPRSYDHKGAAGFLGSRLIRLGIPVLLFALLISGPLSYLTLSGRATPIPWFPAGPAQIAAAGHWASLGDFVGYLLGNGWQPLYAHLWFLLHLLLYGLVYVLWRGLRPGRAGGPAHPDGGGTHPTHGQIALYLLALAGVTWVVRIWYPVDHWVALFFLVPAEVAHLPQYFSLFLLGVLAARRGWPRRIPTRMGMVWLGVGLTAAGLFYLYRLAGGARLLPGLVAKGGPGWPSALWCLWEACICVGLCVGLPVWFREHCDREPGGLARALILAAFGAYIIHFVIVLALQVALAPAALPPSAKFALVALGGIAASFTVSYALRFIPGVTKVL